MKSQIVADAATYVFLEILFNMNDITGQDSVGGTRRTDPPESMVSTTPWSDGFTFTLVAFLLLQVIGCAATEEKMSVISSSPHQRSSLTKSTPTDAPSFIKAGQENSTSVELYYEDLGSGPPASYRSSVTGSAKVTRKRFLLSAGTTIAAMFLLLSHTAEAQVAESGYSLPLSLAVEAATEAIRSCEAHGYAVSASVVDTSGVVKVQLKGDHSTVHTQDTSFRKAYTLVTFGPIFNLDTSTQIAELAKNPAGPGPALTSIPNVLALAGGVAIKRNNEIVATLGVGGSPGGANDEACAEAGVAKIHDRVEAAAAPRSHSADVKK